MKPTWPVSARGYSHCARSYPLVVFDWGQCTRVGVAASKKIASALRNLRSLTGRKFGSRFAFEAFAGADNSPLCDRLDDLEARNPNPLGSRGLGTFAENQGTLRRNRSLRTHTSDLRSFSGLRCSRSDFSCGCAGNSLAATGASTHRAARPLGGNGRRGLTGSYGWDSLFLQGTE